MRANANHDEPLGLLCPDLVAFGIAHGFPVLAARFGDLVLRSVPHEYGLAAPFDDGVLALRDGGELDLDFGEGEDVGGRAHCAEELSDGGFGGGSGEDAHGADHEVGDGTVGRGGGGLVRLEGGRVRGVVCPRRGVEEARLEVHGWGD